jgi:hypothetical protein
MIMVAEVMIVVAEVTIMEMDAMIMAVKAMILGYVPTTIMVLHFIIMVSGPRSWRTSPC